jgi:hypothetical protein
LSPWMKTASPLRFRRKTACRTTSKSTGDGWWPASSVGRKFLQTGGNSYRGESGPKPSSPAARSSKSRLSQSPETAWQRAFGPSAWARSGPEKWGWHSHCITSG